MKPNIFTFQKFAKFLDYCLLLFNNKFFQMICYLIKFTNRSECIPPSIILIISLYMKYLNFIIINIFFILLHLRLKNKFDIWRYLISYKHKSILFKFFLNYFFPIFFVFCFFITIKTDFYPSLK